MSYPEKDPKDAAKSSSEPPQLDAILPDAKPSDPAALSDDIASYQRRLEKEWESAKNAYEQKIDRLMNEFVADGISKLEKEPIQSKTDTKSGRSQRAPLEDLIKQLERELRHDESEQFVKNPTILPNMDAAKFQLAWKSSGIHMTWRNWIAAISALLLVAGFIGWLTLWRVSSIALPYAHTLSPLVEKDKLYIMDWFRKTLFVHLNRGSLPIVSVEALPNNLATGFAMSDKSVWTLDSLDLKINVHNRTIDHQVVSSAQTPETRPVGLFFDGTDLWSADQDVYKLYRHRGNDVEEVRDSFPLPDITITGFIIDKNRLWLLDGKSRLLTIYRLQKPLLKLASYDLDALLGQATPTGIAVRGKSVLLTTENPSKLLRIPLFRLRHSKLKLTF